MIPPRPARGRHGRSRRGRHRASATAAAARLSLAAGVLLVLALLAVVPRAAPSQERAPAGALPAAAAASSAVLLQDVRPAGAQAPVRIRIPSIGVDSTLEALGIGEDGALGPPVDFGRAGWFTQSAVPGEVGPSVIAGHVDSTDGPAVFFRLRDLAPGDEVLVELSGGTTVRFVVSRRESHPKDRFPTEAVYGPTPRAELRLITCGGDFDADLRSYRDNVVVSAVRA